MGVPRLQSGPLTTALQLGPLASLVGWWSGPGFNAIWRPDNIQPAANSAIHRLLELNLTIDWFNFQVIPGAVPNRGFNTRPTWNCTVSSSCSATVTPTISILDCWAGPQSSPDC